MIPKQPCMSKKCQDAQLRRSQSKLAQTAAALAMCNSSTTIRLGDFTGKDAGVLGARCCCGSRTVFLLSSLQHQNCVYLTDLAMNFVSLTCLETKHQAHVVLPFWKALVRKLIFQFCLREIFNAHEKQSAA